MITNKNYNISWQNVFIFMWVVAMIISGSDVAMATTASSNDVIGKTLCNIVYNITGNFAKAVASIAIFAVGVGLFMGKINWGLGLATGAGVGVIFGANKLVVWITGATGSWDTNCGTGTLT